MSERELSQAIHAAELLRSQIGDLIASDPDFLPEAVEAETSLFELVNAVTESVIADEAVAYGLDAAVDRLKARRTAIAERAGIKRAMIAVALETAGCRRHDAPCATITIKAVPPKLVVTEESDVPARFWKTSAPVIDRTALLAALKAKASEPDLFPPIPGATLSNGGSTVQIKVL